MQFVNVQDSPSSAQLAPIAGSTLGQLDELVPPDPTLVEPGPFVAVVPGPVVPVPVTAPVVFEPIAPDPVAPVLLVEPPEPFEACSVSEASLVSPQAVATSQIKLPAPTDPIPNFIVRGA